MIYDLTCEECGEDAPINMVPIPNSKWECRKCLCVNTTPIHPKLTAIDSTGYALSIDRLHQVKINLNKYEREQLETLKYQYSCIVETNSVSEESVLLRGVEVGFLMSKIHNFGG